MQIWSWILTIIGLIGFFLAGRKIWWCWYVNIANQLIWTIYAVLTMQWGFLVGVVAYTFIFIQNARNWTQEHKEARMAAATPHPAARPDVHPG